MLDAVAAQIEVGHPAARRLADAKMVRLIGNGCGFKSIKLPNWDDFKGLPIIKDLPPMPSGLPPLPEDLADVPFPDFSGLTADAG